MMEYQSIPDTILERTLPMQYDLLFLLMPEPSFCLCLHPQVFLDVSQTDAGRLSNKVADLGFSELTAGFESLFGRFGVAGVLKGDIASISWPPLAFTVPLTKLSGEPGVVYRLALSATLNLLLQKVNYPKEIFRSMRVQCLSLEVSCGRDSASGRFNLTVRLSPAMRKWLGANLAGHIAEVEEAMQMLWRAGAENDSSAISVTDQGDAGFLLNVPGSAAGMVFRPHDSSSKPCDGLIGSSNNIDYTTTQLTLLAGIGTLCRLYREAGNY